MGYRLLTVLLLVCVPGTSLARCLHVHAGDSLGCPVRPHLHLPFSPAHSGCSCHHAAAESAAGLDADAPDDHEDGTVDVVTDQLAERAGWVLVGEEPHRTSSSLPALLSAFVLEEPTQVPRPPPRQALSCPLYLQLLHLLV